VGWIDAELALTALAAQPDRRADELRELRSISFPSIDVSRSSIRRRESTASGHEQKWEDPVVGSLSALAPAEGPSLAAHTTRRRCR
jgi:hypothetical protein